MADDSEHLLSLAENSSTHGLCSSSSSEPALSERAAPESLQTKVLLLFSQRK